MEDRCGIFRKLSLVALEGSVRRRGPGYNVAAVYEPLKDLKQILLQER